MVDAAGIPPPAALPVPRTRLIGRKAEGVVARQFLLDAAVPLLTLTGPGVGKTRLTLDIANDVADHCRDGTEWVEIDQFTDPMPFTDDT